jgi:hypothetical protein
MKGGPSVLLYALFALVFAVGVLIGAVLPTAMIYSAASRRQGGAQETDMSASTVSQGDPNHMSHKFDPTNEQLVERVKDSSSHLSSLISLVGIIVALIAAVFGASIWETRRYAVSVVDSHFGPKFAKFREDELEPLLTQTREAFRLAESQVRNAHDSAVRSLLDVYRAIWTMVSESMNQLDKIQSEAEGLSGRELESRLQERSRRRKAQYETSYLTVCLTSYDEDVVINAAHQLPEMGDLAVAALPTLEKVLDRWPSGSRVRAAAQRGIDKIKLTARDGGTSADVSE